MASSLSDAQSPTPSPASQLRAQWSNPGDILSVLLIVGADVIKTALAQFTSQQFKPVAFSYGWVAYAYSYLLSTVGQLKPIPEPEFPSFLINCESGKVWERSSWLLGRILHHYDAWAPEERRLEDIKFKEQDRRRVVVVGDDVESALKLQKAERTPRRGLAVAVFAPSTTKPQGVPSNDWVAWTGVATAILQLAFAAVPCGLYGEWEVLLLTACGTLLAWLMGYLQERSISPRKNTQKTFALTKGTGYRDAIVILGNGSGLDLEDLANEGLGLGQNHSITVAIAVVMVILWTALLITTSGMKSNTWYLIAIGGIGMLQNIHVAGARRHPSAYGIHLQLKAFLARPTAMVTLMELEKAYPGAGRSLLNIFFPGPLKPEEYEFWYKRSTEGTEPSKAATSN
jgi:hypothetical protein